MTYFDYAVSNTATFWFSLQSVESSVDAYFSSLNRKLKYNLSFPPVKLGQEYSLEQSSIL